MKKYIVFIFLFIFSILQAQINELGLAIGGSNYIGDIGKTTYINPNNSAFGLVYKWNYSPRIVYRFDANFIKISADDAKSDNIIRQRRGNSFSNSIKEFALGVEFNYYDYSLTVQEYNSTPYLIVQFAMTNYNVIRKETSPNVYETEAKTGFTIPIGIGYKTGIGRKIGVAIETKLRYTFADDLDYNTEAYQQLNFGNPNSNDWYVTTGITIVFGFGRKGCYSGEF